MKFGGSSVGSAERIRVVAGLVAEAAAAEPIIAVFSAFRGVTDLLIRAARGAEAADAGYHAALAELEEKSRLIAGGLFADGAVHYRRSVEPLVAELRDLLRGIELVHECTLRSLDLIMSFGERISCTLIAAYLETIGVSAPYFDARNLVVTDNSHGSAVVDYARTNPRLTAALAPHLSALGSVPVVTGFLAADPEGVTTTLGRNGSDFTASIVGAALDVDAIEIWTDVDGVLSADPRAVAGAFVVPRVSYAEAMELSYFGAKVIHPQTMIPAVEKKIPIIIRNTLNPNAPGTRISEEAEEHDYPATGITSVEGLALLNVQGGGMVGTPGIASRVFSSLARAGVNVIMISQASSEHSICLVFRESEARDALRALEAELAFERSTHRIDPFELRPNLEILAVVGEGMKGKPGVAGRLFSALGAEGVSIHAIAQGSSEMNISCVIDTTERDVALNAVHKAFFGR